MSWWNILWRRVSPLFQNERRMVSATIQALSGWKAVLNLVSQRQWPVVMSQSEAVCCDVLSLDTSKFIIQSDLKLASDTFLLLETEDILKHFPPITLHPRRIPVGISSSKIPFVNSILFCPKSLGSWDQMKGVREGAVGLNFSFFQFFFFYLIF